MHGDGDKIRNKQYVCIIELRCSVCGKTFVPAPEHVYHDGKRKVCSWNCQVKAERRRDAEKVKKKTHRGIRVDPGRDKEIVRLAKEGVPLVELAAKFHVSKGRICQIVRANRE